ncbi:HNH endonuclease family protein [Saccharopolyspora spinosa]|uniref:Uncharacterized protein DUF1524 n=1 Tax=Saccharopolyspora spinosa TaxID=60894 RepID=A0A2N3Y963_SACSN|nr:HNH endonuclease family protein [Saccharopolyspora spinosa]PKW19458.1 uncharacterized protein DUF1524 [Saccharopolyspora spinosa]
MRLPRALVRRLSFLAPVLAMVFSVASAPTALAFPPGVPGKSQVQSELTSLSVQAEGGMTGYSRDLFPHWHTVSGTCNTREEVLRCDGTNVAVGSDCYPTSGSWYSYYDGVTRTSPSQISIDHIVPLAEAWRSGARSWTTAKREAFANDLTGPQLIAVTTEVNSAKGDRDPSSWKPPRTASHCGYAKFRIHTKHRWGPTLQSAEKTALQNMLNACSY